MHLIGEWLRRVWYLLNRRRIDEALRQEMEAHRASMGHPAGFGNTLRLREEARDVWGWTLPNDGLRRRLARWRWTCRRTGAASIWNPRTSGTWASLDLC